MIALLTNNSKATHLTSFHCVNQWLKKIPKVPKKGNFKLYSTLKG